MEAHSNREGGQQQRGRNWGEVLGRKKNIGEAGRVRREDDSREIERAERDCYKKRVDRKSEKKSKNKRQNRGVLREETKRIQRAEEGFFVRNQC